jgi:pimeloyl-ACP methyl ester carboxylesterase
VLGIGSVGVYWPHTANPPEHPAPEPEPAVTVEEVQFRHRNDVLAGAFYRPARSDPCPAVALVFGSGPRDRSCGGVGPVLGRHFALNGLACLTWDKPGVGRSTGDFNAQTFEDRAGEALAAVRFLRARPEVRTNQVGLWGHSQGGAVVPLAASRSPDVAFLIQVAGWQGPAWKQDPVRVAAELRAAHFPETDVAEAVAFAERRMALIRNNRPFAELDRAQEAVQGARWFGAVQRCDRVLFESAQRQVGHDSGPSWEGVRCPVLVIYGDRDLSTGQPEGLVDIIRRGLERGGNRDLVVKIFANANHSLCRPKVAREAVGHLEGTRRAEQGPDFVPGYLATMTSWALERTAPGR